MKNKTDRFLFKERYKSARGTRKARKRGACCERLLRGIPFLWAID
jgi:hypothetical protein